MHQLQEAIDGLSKQYLENQGAQKELQLQLVSRQEELLSGWMNQQGKWQKQIMEQQLEHGKHWYESFHMIEQMKYQQQEAIQKLINIQAHLGAHIHQMHRKQLEQAELFDEYRAFAEGVYMNETGHHVNTQARLGYLVGQLPVLHPGIAIYEEVKDELAREERERVEKSHESVRTALEEWKKARLAQIRENTSRHKEDKQEGEHEHSHERIGNTFVASLEKCSLRCALKVLPNVSQREEGSGEEEKRGKACPAVTTAAPLQLLPPSELRKVVFPAVECRHRVAHERERETDSRGATHDRCRRSQARRRHHPRSCEEPLSCSYRCAPSSFPHPEPSICRHRYKGLSLEPRLSLSFRRRCRSSRCCRRFGVAAIGATSGDLFEKCMEIAQKCLDDVPRVESKLRVFSFKIQFLSQVTEFKKSLKAVNSACEEDPQLDSSWIVLADRSPGLLDFHLDLVSMEAMTKPAVTASVTYDHKAIVVNGQRKILFSGSIHYPRSTPQIKTEIKQSRIRVTSKAPVKHKFSWIHLDDIIKDDLEDENKD
ncbi:hypothetical protein Ahy_B05g077368 [Arachis hypogaea]|uniref:Beta-galactosidase n=1 Tax=Arachis hypogaea TaxID=3818 RepID=A0A444Z4S3_ARAHY|nr:hypothetical protein Ahy_B05g077368 [Arachis hypogaea]